MEVTDKKRHILEQAEELFAQKGFDAATIRDIAEAANVNLAMISYYFGSKDKLMESLFTERMELMKVKVESLLQDTALSPFKKIEVMIADYTKKVTARQSFSKILLCEQAMQKNPVILRLIRDLKLNYAAMFSELVKDGQKKKVFKKNIDVVMAVTTLWGTVTQMVVNRDFYIEFYGLAKMEGAELNKLLQEKLNLHLVNIFKTILGYES